MRDQAISFFDGNAVIGRPASPTFGSWLSSQSLLAELDQFGIDEALIAHVHSQELDGVAGNHLAFKAAASSPRLHVQAALFPRFGKGARAAIAQELDALTRAGCMAVRLHPNPTHHIMDDGVYARQYELTPTMAGTMLEALEARRIPVFVELAQTNWREIADVCRAYPELPLVAVNVSYTHKRSLFALFDAVDNFFCDTSCFHAYRGLEEACELFGSGRFVFGTRSPAYNPLAAKALVLYAEIDDAAKAAIAGDNLRGLLRRARTASDATTADSETEKEKVKR